MKRALKAAGRRGKRRTLIAAALLVLVAGGAAVALAGGSEDGSAAADDGGATASAKVERRTLAEQLTASGTIGYAGESTVLARLTGTVTALPGVGDRIERGEQLYALGGEPVLLLYGEVPAYRELAEGVEDGVDVEQLERNLAALGYEPGTVDEEFTSSTAAAVSAWQEDLDLEATGAVELGRVAFLPGPRRVTAVEATLGEAIGSGGGSLTANPSSDGTTTLVAYETPAVEEGVESPQESTLPEQAPAEEEETDEDEAEEKGKEDGKPEPKADEEKPEGKEETPHSESPAAASSRGEGAPEGDGEGEASDPASIPILKTSSTKRIVSVELDPDQQSIAHRGQTVGVLLPGGEQARGKVRRIAVTEGASSEAPGGEETEPGVEVSVSLLGKTRVPALDGAAVSVLFTQNVREHVLSVPLTALVAIGGKRFAVVAIEGGERRRIEVEPGLAADGYVEVRGKGLRAGMTVESGE